MSIAASGLPSSSSHPARGDEDPENGDELLEGEVVEERRRREARLDLQASRYVSPLPSPDDLERYQEMVPDAPERLLAAGEREQGHRHGIEERLVAIDESSMPRFYAGQKRAHVVGLILGMAYLAVMALAIIQGEQVAGIAGAAAGVAALVWAARRDPSGPSSPDVTARDPQNGEESPPAEPPPSEGTNPPQTARSAGPSPSSREK